MPYSITKSGSKWVVKNKHTGHIKGTHTSKEKALRQMRVLYMVESGKKPTGKKSRTSHYQHSKKVSRETKKGGHYKT